MAVRETLPCKICAKLPPASIAHHRARLINISPTVCKDISNKVPLLRLYGETCCICAVIYKKDTRYSTPFTKSVKGCGTQRCLLVTVQSPNTKKRTILSRWLRETLWVWNGLFYPWTSSKKSEHVCSNFFKNTTIVQSYAIFRTVWNDQFVNRDSATFTYDKTSVCFYLHVDERKC